MNQSIMHVREWTIHYCLRVCKGVRSAVLQINARGLLSRILSILNLNGCSIRKVYAECMNDCLVAECSNFNTSCKLSNNV